MKFLTSNSFETTLLSGVTVDFIISSLAGKLVTNEIHCAAREVAAKGKRIDWPVGPAY